MDSDVPLIISGEVEDQIGELLGVPGKRFSKREKKMLRMIRDLQLEVVKQEQEGVIRDAVIRETLLRGPVEIDVQAALDGEALHVIRAAPIEGEKGRLLFFLEAKKAPEAKE